MTNQTVLVLDFGAKTKSSAAKMIRECNVYSKIVPYDLSIEDIKAADPIGLVLLGDSADVNDPACPKCRPELFELDIPVLGIGYGMQAMTFALMGRVENRRIPEIGKVGGLVDVTCPLFDGMVSDQTMHMCHAADVTILPRGFENYGRTAECRNAVMGDASRRLFGVQFHPELDTGTNGLNIMRNFLYRVCGAKGDYDMDRFEEAQIDAIRARVGSDRVMLALSGGMDSAVCAALLTKALPGQLCCVLVDHGFLRENEAEEIEAIYKNSAIDIVRVDASRQFLAAVEGIVDPDEIRRRIDRVYSDVLRAEAKRIGDVRYLAKGTVYSDVIDSNEEYDEVALAEDAGFKGIIEPLRGLFKDEVKLLGRKIGLSKQFLGRQPFPAMGLATRIMGEITAEKLDILRRADTIFRTELQKTRCQTNQHYAILGVCPPYNGGDYTVILRAVSSGGYTEIPHRTLSRISSRITDELSSVSRVVYDITNTVN